MEWLFILMIIVNFILPVVLFIIWAAFLKEKYSATYGFINLIYFIVGITLLINQLHLNAQKVAVLSIFQIFSVIALVSLILAWMTGKQEGVIFWRSITWKFVKLFGHPFILYPALFIISIYMYLVPFV